MLIGRVHAHLTSGTPQKRLIEDMQEFERVLQHVFGLREPEIDTLWRKVVARHETLFGDQPADAIELLPT